MIALSGFPDDFSIASTSSLGVPPGKFRSNRVNSGPGVEPGKPGTPTGMALSGNPCGTCCKTCWPNVGWHETRNPVASRTMICFIGLVFDCFVHKGTRPPRRNPARFPAKSCQARGTNFRTCCWREARWIPSQRVARKELPSEIIERKSRPIGRWVNGQRGGGTCSADCQSAVSQDAILQDGALDATSERRQRPADWQSAIGSLAPARSVLRTFAPLRGTKPFRRFPSGSSQQINNLRYAKQILRWD